ncbi:hypothetical protein J5N97_013276 [Dioscorea zingiberensis]|uniref:Uncharacterized protein n=1 Tax=Dioscorea zingiberensis TaxID=325984 RepID=A0A9D5CSN3_9LILI|nr:hypothetical protein J5N97_013276 [Dioscorea zingiberensis]
MVARFVIYCNGKENYHSLYGGNAFSTSGKVQAYEWPIFVVLWDDMVMDMDHNQQSTLEYLIQGLLLGMTTKRG